MHTLRGVLRRTSKESVMIQNENAFYIPTSEFHENSVYYVNEGINIMALNTSIFRNPLMPVRH